MCYLCETPVSLGVLYFMWHLGHPHSKLWWWSSGQVRLGMGCTCQLKDFDGEVDLGSEKKKNQGTWGYLYWNGGDRRSGSSVLWGGQALFKGMVDVTWRCGHWVLSELEIIVRSPSIPIPSSLLLHPHPHLVFLCSDRSHLEDSVTGTSYFLNEHLNPSQTAVERNGGTNKCTSCKLN